MDRRIAAEFAFIRDDGFGTLRVSLPQLYVRLFLASRAMFSGIVFPSCALVSIPPSGFDQREAQLAVLLVWAKLWRVNNT